VRAVSFSPDGSFFATAGGSATAGSAPSTDESCIMVWKSNFDIFSLTGGSNSIDVIAQATAAAAASEAAAFSANIGPQGSEDASPGDASMAVSEGVASLSAGISAATVRTRASVPPVSPTKPPFISSARVSGQKKTGTLPNIKNKSTNTNKKSKNTKSVFPNKKKQSQF
jgi:hypothetical protein